VWRSVRFFRYLCVCVCVWVFRSFKGVGLTNFSEEGRERFFFFGIVFCFTFFFECGVL